MLNETDNSGSTALIACCKRSYKTSILKILLDKGSKVVNHCDSKGLTALHFSVMEQSLDETKLLIQYGANVNMKSNAGDTPLHLAVRNVDVVKFLLDNHADVNALDGNGDTALFYASQSFSDLPETVEVLIRSGSDVNHRNKDGMSALFLAVENAHEASMKLLLDAHCDLNDAVADDQPPKSVLSIVLNKWCPNVVSQNMALTLLKYGATSRYVRPDVIHRLIVMENDELIQKLILSGVCPSDIILNRKIFAWPFLSISPFVICLIMDQINMAQFFFDHWYLTKSDIRVLSRNKSILDYMDRKNSETSQFLEKISSQPLRLELLCFISISSVLGSGPDRREKIQKCPIPKILQDCLILTSSEMSGQQVSESLTSSEVSGQQISVSVASSEVSGQQVSESLTSSEVSGQQVSVNLTSSEVDGQQVSVNLTSSEVSGQQVSVSLTSSEVDGQQVSVNLTSSEVSGQQVSVSLTSIIVSGQQVSVSLTLDFIAKCLDQMSTAMEMTEVML
ncbi:hypothetical protein Btru_077696 [Bulinus truncatus]|nr:hypothetical protein Btru_077696 [Bulinus truncatus]